MNRLELLAGGGGRLPTEPLRVLGIDLGTTNSCVSEIIWDPDTPERIVARCLDLEQETLQGVATHVLVPSIVALYEGRALIGEGAKRLRGQGLRKDQSIFYECKNDIGLGKTYHRAPEGFKSAVAIGGKILNFLRQAAERECELSPNKVVVTVPASFQANQRGDTVEAAGLAGLNLDGGQLLDEPVAAFVDYLMSKGGQLTEQLAESKTLVVFDFGGGTCDVAVFRLEVSKEGGINVSTLAVSRYHRLGGGDIDAALVHQVLIPQLRAQNGLSEFDLGYTEKKMQVEPALLGVAEQLKIGLCDEIRRLQAFGKYEDADKTKITKTEPGSREVRVGQQRYELTSPRLTAAELEEVLEPFFDEEILFARESDYHMTCSIFAPLQDAIERCNLSQREIDLCLLVGGSSLIPQVVERVDQFFPRATMLTYSDRDSVKACISQGAAYQALALAIRGKGFVQQVCHDEIAIRTGEGLVTLVPRGTALPYPGAGEQSQVCRNLAVPKGLTENEQCPLRIELVTDSGRRRLFNQTWTIPGPARAGAPLALAYRLDENQVMELRMSRADGGDATSFVARFEKPLANVVNPQSKQWEALQLEEDLKTQGWPEAQMLREMVRLACLYSDLGQREKAIATLQNALRVKRVADTFILNKIGILCSELGDYQREEKYLLEASRASQTYVPLFNLAFSKRKQRKTADAIESVEKSLKIERNIPALVLRAQLASDNGENAVRDKCLDEALRHAGAITTLDDWQLGWLQVGARMAGRQDILESTSKELQSRHRDTEVENEVGMLPQMSDPTTGD